MRILLSIALAGSFLASCQSDGWSEEDERFVGTYTAILVAREQIADSARAQQEVETIIADSGYSRESFEREFRSYMESAEKLRAMLDTARARARERGVDPRK